MSTNNNIGIVYGLICPLSKDIRYIGQTTRKLSKRIYGHKYEALKEKRGKMTYKENWLRELINLGKLDEIENIVLETCLLQELDEREMYWIEYYKNKGNKLTNILPGGKSCRGFKKSQEVKGKISLGIRNSTKYQIAIKNPARGEKISKKLKNVPKSEKAKENMKKAQKLYFQTHEGTFKGKKHTEETKLKQSISHKKTFENRPGTFTNKSHTQETKDKIRKKLQKEVGLYDLEHVLIKKFPSIKELSEYFGLDKVTGVKSNLYHQKMYKKKYWLKYINS